MIQKNPTQDYKDGFIEATELLASHMLRKIERQPDLLRTDRMQLKAAVKTTAEWLADFRRCLPDTPDGEPPYKLNYKHFD